MVLMLTENIPISFKNLKTKAADSSGHLSASVALGFLFFFPDKIIVHGLSRALCH